MEFLVNLSYSDCHANKQKTEPVLLIMRVHTQSREFPVWAKGERRGKDDDGEKQINLYKFMNLLIS